MIKRVGALLAPAVLISACPSHGVAEEPSCFALDPNEQPALAFQRCSEVLRADDLETSQRFEALLNRGIAARELGYIDASEADLRASTAIFPRNGNALRMLAWTLRESGNYRGAETIYTDVLKFDDSWQGWLSRCVVRTDLQLWISAISDCQKALSQSETEDTYFFLSLAQSGAQLNKEALATVQRGLNSGVRSPRLYLEGIRAARQIGRQAEAEKLLDDGQSYFPEDERLSNLGSDLN